MRRHSRPALRAAPWRPMRASTPFPTQHRIARYATSSRIASFGLSNCPFPNLQVQDQGHLLAATCENGFLTILDTRKNLPFNLDGDGECMPRANWQAHHNGIFDVAWCKVSHTITARCSMQCAACGRCMYAFHHGPTPLHHGTSGRLAHHYKQRRLEHRDLGHSNGPADWMLRWTPRECQDGMSPPKQ